jgi:Flp pilus assembly protein TadD/SAM-dependent methyltransferase
MASTTMDMATAWQLHQTGRNRHARRLCDEVLAADPDNPEALRLIGAIALGEGDSAGAIAYLTRALIRAPRNAHVHTILGLAYRDAGAPTEAREYLRNAVEIDPHSAISANNLGSFLLDSGEVSEACAHLDRAVSIDPGLSQARRNLASALSRLGRNREAVEVYRKLFAAGAPDEGLQVYRQALKRDSRRPNIRAAMVKCLRAARIDRTGPALVEVLRGLLDADEVDNQGLVAVVIRVLARESGFQDGIALAGSPDRAALAAGFRAGNLDGIIEDALFLRLLQTTVVTDLGFERLTAALRRGLLIDHANPDSPMPESRFALAVAIAHQGFNTEYIHDRDDLERAMCQAAGARAIRRLEAVPGPDRNLAEVLAIAAMYEPLHGFIRADRMAAWPDSAWPAPIRSLIEATVRVPLVERAIASRITPVVATTDAVSRRVKSQYEDHPYPRWFTLPRPGAVRPSAHLAAILPGFVPPAMIDGPIAVLVAGCGTGREALFLAELFEDAMVTAIDLSRASLGYAIAKAAALAIRNAAFRECDILNVTALGRRFDLITSSGVLHHLDSPEAGLAALAEVLAPGGLVHLSLYSRTARRPIAAARARIAALGLEPDAEGLRAFRRHVQDQDDGDPLKWLTRTSDFYCASGVRDLAFHAREHVYDLSEIAPLVEAAGLEFVGLQVDPETRRTFAHEAPGAAPLTDLDAWRAFEDRHPETFVNMYSFWCRKPGP